MLYPHSERGASSGGLGEGFCVAGFGVVAGCDAVGVAGLEGEAAVFSAGSPDADSVLVDGLAGCSVVVLSEEVLSEEVVSGAWTSEGCEQAVSAIAIRDGKPTASKRDFIIECPVILYLF